MTAEKLMRARCNNKKDESLYPIASIETSQNAKEYIGSKKVWSKNHHSNIVTFWFGSNHSIRSMVPRRYATDTLNSQWLITLSWTRNIDVTSFWSPFTPLFNWTEHLKRKYCICVCLFSICVHCHQMHAYRLWSSLFSVWIFLPLILSPSRMKNPCIKQWCYWWFCTLHWIQ